VDIIAHIWEMSIRIHPEICPSDDGTGHIVADLIGIYCDRSGPAGCDMEDDSESG
jgi:hypothetical protein